MSTLALEFDLPMFAAPQDAAEDLKDAMHQIDEMTFEGMLRMVRCAPLDDPLFRGEVGKYFHAALKTKRGQLSPEARAEISKRVGC